MLLKVDVPLKTMDGVVMKDTNSDGEVVDATIRLIIVNALMNSAVKEPGMEKLKKYELAKKIYTSDEVDLDEKEIALIKDRVGDLFTPLVVGQIYELLKV